MPFGDRTGPAGFGPMTGRGAGFCTGNATPGYINPAGRLGLGRGTGFGRGFGRGRGYGRSYGPACYGAPPYAAAPAPTREQELEMLKSQADLFNSQISEVNKRIEELEKENK